MLGCACDEDAGTEAPENIEGPEEEVVAAEEAGVKEKPVKELVVVPDEGAAELAGTAVEVGAAVLAAGGALGVALNADKEKAACVVLLAAGVEEAVVVVVTVENNGDEDFENDNEVDAGADDDAALVLVNPNAGCEAEDAGVPNERLKPPLDEGTVVVLAVDAAVGLAGAELGNDEKLEELVNEEVAGAADEALGKPAKA